MILLKFIIAHIVTGIQIMGYPSFLSLSNDENLQYEFTTIRLRETEPKRHGEQHAILY